jgi:hypothetical protein
MGQSESGQNSYLSQSREADRDAGQPLFIAGISLFRGSSKNMRHIYNENIFASSETSYVKFNLVV